MSSETIVVYDTKCHNGLLAKLDRFYAQKKIQCVYFQPSSIILRGRPMLVFLLLSAYDLHELVYEWFCCVGKLLTLTRTE